MRISLEVINILVLLNNDISTLQTMQKNFAATSKCYHQEFNKCFPTIVDEYGVPNRFPVKEELDRIVELTTDVISDLRTLAGDLCLSPYQKKIIEGLNYLGFIKLNLIIQPKEDADGDQVLNSYMNASNYYGQLASELERIIKELKKARETLAPCFDAEYVITPE